MTCVMHDGNVGCILWNIYTATFLFSDYLYFLWYGNTNWAGREEVQLFSQAIWHGINDC